MLYDFCASHGVPHTKCGKLVVATSEPEIEKLGAIRKQPQINGVEGVEMIEGAAARRMEPELACVAALHSPETGVVDSHALHDCAARRPRRPRRHDRVQHQDRADHAGAGRVAAAFGGGDSIPVDAVVNCGWSRRAKTRRAPPKAIRRSRVPRLFLGKGSYFGYAGRPAFSRLIYPAPIHGGLGVHVTLDLAGRMRFGPGRRMDRAGELRRRPEARGGVLRQPSANISRACRTARWCPTMRASGRS